MLGGRQTQTCPAETRLLSEITLQKPKPCLYSTNSSNVLQIWSSVWLQISCLCLIVLIFFFFSSFWTSQLLSFAPGWSRHWWPLAAHQTWGQRGERMDGRMLDRGQAGMEGVGRSPPPQYVCGSQAKKRCCSPEGRVSLPESLWHLLQVLVSVGFKLHILNGGQSHKNTPNIMQYVAAKSG